MVHGSCEWASMLQHWILSPFLLLIMPLTYYIYRICTYEPISGKMSPFSPLNLENRIYTFLYVQLKSITDYCVFTPSNSYVFEMNGDLSLWWQRWQIMMYFHSIIKIYTHKRSNARTMAYRLYVRTITVYTHSRLFAH